MVIVGLLLKDGSNCAPWSDGSPAAVCGDDRAGYVAGLGRGQEDDHVGDLVGLGDPRHDGRGANGLGTSSAWMGVYTGPDATALTRTPAGLYSAAQERVMESSAALVAP